MLPCLLFPPLEERPAYYQAILMEMLEELVKRRHGRRIHRGVKRKMGRYPIRKRGTEPLPALDVATALELLK